MTFWKISSGGWQYAETWGVFSDKRRIWARIVKQSATIANNTQHIWNKRNIRFRSVYETLRSDKKRLSYGCMNMRVHAPHCTVTLADRRNSSRSHNLGSTQPNLMIYTPFDSSFVAYFNRVNNWVNWVRRGNFQPPRDAIISCWFRTV